jgi:hypothetical protein
VTNPLSLLFNYYPKALIELLTTLGLRALGLRVIYNKSIASSVYRLDSFNYYVSINGLRNIVVKSTRAEQDVLGNRRKGVRLTGIEQGVLGNRHGSVKLTRTEHDVV